METNASGDEGLIEEHVDLEDDSINFWATLDVSPHVHVAVGEHETHIPHQDHMDHSLDLVEANVRRDLFETESDHRLEPYVGMEFESGEAAKTFYIAYAGRVGFCVRIARSRRSKCNETVIMLRFVCSREGWSREKRIIEGKKTRKRAASIREGCRAMLEVIRKGDGRWVVTKLVKEHNHEVGMPSRVHYIATEEGPMEPYLGMEFDSLEMARTFYYAYASRVGFEARVRQSRRSLHDESLKMLKLVCSKHRYHSGRENHEDGKGIQGQDLSKDGCDALFEIIRKDGDKWVVSKLVVEHSHPLTPTPPSKVRCVRSQGADNQDSISKVADKYFTAKTQLRVAVRQLGQALACRQEKEAQADYDTLFNKPFLKTASPMEKQAAGIYTRTVFDRFQEEFVESLGYHVDKIEDGTISKYCVTKNEDARGAYIVTFNASDNKATCSCCMFEFSGILCRHALRVFIIVGIRTLPRDYVLKRWTRNAKSNVVSDEYGVGLRGASDEPSTARYNDLSRDAMRCAREGATSVEFYKVAKEALQKAAAEIISAKQKKEQQTLQNFIKSQKNKKQSKMSQKKVFGIKNVKKRMSKRGITEKQNNDTEMKDVVEEEGET
ncbi:hypothetical protein Taro_020042 [Colocasia esculenta]|uniref:Protein FAR1-RELATED SEQUENCE n=1 Tax=Colocasia esculenta TaxID=4460 RepID=A0A843UXU7_COLES|nr:hypothetical protein [Colocasia esculenta]